MGNNEEVLLLTSDTFLQALRGIETARLASSANFHAKAWLLQIAVNAVRMQRRRRSLVRFVPFSVLREERQEENDLEPLCERPAPVQPAGYGMGSNTKDPAEIVAERDAVRRTLRQLPPTLRHCLLLSIVGGLPTREIARLLGLKEPAVRQRLARARKLFQQFYLRESGEAIIDGRPLRSRTEPGNLQLTLPIQPLHASAYA